MKLSDRSMWQICHNIDHPDGYKREELGQRFPADFTAEGRPLPDRESDGPGESGVVVVDGVAYRFPGRQGEQDMDKCALKATMYTANIPNVVKGNEDVYDYRMKKRDSVAAEWDTQFKKLEAEYQDLKNAEKRRRNSANIRNTKLDKRDELLKHQMKVFSTKQAAEAKRQAEKYNTLTAQLQDMYQKSISAAESTFVKRQEELEESNGKLQEEFRESYRKLQVELEKEYERRYTELAVSFQSDVAEFDTTQDKLTGEIKELEEKEASCEQDQDIEPIAQADDPSENLLAARTRILFLEEQMEVALDKIADFTTSMKRYADRFGSGTSMVPRPDEYITKCFAPEFEAMLMDFITDYRLAGDYTSTQSILSIPPLETSN
jgi:hypothetical protein